MKILYNYIKTHKTLLYIALFLATVNQCFSLYDSIIIGKLLNECGVGVANFSHNQGSFIKAVSGWLLLSLGAAMASRIAKNFQDYFTNIIIQRTGAQMYTDGIQKALQLPFQDFEDQRSGETLGKLQKVKIDCEKFITLSISLIFQSIVGIVFVVVYAVSIHWLLGPIFLITVPVIAFVSSFLGKKIKKISREILGETTALAGATTESLRNIELVKSLGLTQQEVNRLNATTVKILGLELKKVRFIRSLSFIQGTTVHFMRTSLVFALYLFIFHDIIKPGDLITLMFFSFFLFNPLQELGNVIATYNETKASMDNFADLMNAKIEKTPKNPKTIGPINHLSFQNVSFKHLTAKNYAVKNISFEAKVGETIAFVGPSGSGKTTLVKMLVGLYNPAEGTIFYNEKNAQEIDLNELRQQLGFVTQDAQLFSGTIKDNLLFVKPDATDEEIHDVLQKSACQNLLKRAEKGINTTIGEGGVKVSGGEKQRLSIARALLRKPHLLLFDEATSALDSITEEEITKTIRSISSKQDQITVLIAHRLSTIMHADKIFVLEQGEIIEQGKHQDLLDEKGLYYAMWRQQIGERKE
ncbi:ATP-binding cassette, subfamily B [Flavobacterium glycines]|uniref:ABC transporter ATP-binding protein n=1 Tax=Flavobacterium glycines TaxID=551990 RepID=A0A1B9DSA8_9FLAO|nr:ABC transporter ATP-binding protein [Flavobacterium glycines]OCB72555.1 ABC transporter ATP-binding protein [Flavobacterium glycines]GEL10047.1 ABC transporter ATP-binding protein [Flavobacterium glycines]SDI83442.1 ATP-binding cassette, subfamily B [Flavobacterium glycines]